MKLICINKTHSVELTQLKKKKGGEKLCQKSLINPGNPGPMWPGDYF